MTMPDWLLGHWSVGGEESGGMLVVEPSWWGAVGFGRKSVPIRDGVWTDPPMEARSDGSVRLGDGRNRGFAVVVREDGDGGIVVSSGGVDCALRMRGPRAEPPDPATTDQRKLALHRPAQALGFDDPAVHELVGLALLKAGRRDPGGARRLAEAVVVAILCADEKHAERSRRALQPFLNDTENPAADELAGALADDELSPRAIRILEDYADAGALPNLYPRSAAVLFGALRALDRPAASHLAERISGAVDTEVAEVSEKLDRDRAAERAVKSRPPADWPPKIVVWGSRLVLEMNGRRSWITPKGAYQQWAGDQFYASERWADLWCEDEQYYVREYEKEDIHGHHELKERWYLVKRGVGLRRVSKPKNARGLGGAAKEWPPG